MSNAMMMLHIAENLNKENRFAIEHRKIRPMDSIGRMQYFANYSRVEKCLMVRTI